MGGLKPAPQRFKPPQTVQEAKQEKRVHRKMKRKIMQKNRRRQRKRDKAAYTGILSFAMGSIYFGQRPDEMTFAPIHEGSEGKMTPSRSCRLSALSNNLASPRTPRWNDGHDLPSPRWSGVLGRASAEL